jgi:hypothetical protein
VLPGNAAAPAALATTPIQATSAEQLTLTTMMITACRGFVLGTIGDAVCALRRIPDPWRHAAFLALIVAALAHRTVNPK